MSDRALQLKVGAVLIAALVVFGGFVMVLGDFGLSRGIRLQIDYAFSGAIQPGAPVRVSGVKVGRVTDMKFLGGTVLDKNGEPLQVRVICDVEEQAKPVLREGARFYVNTQGLIGEHYIEIVPAKEPGPPIAPGAIVRGIDPPRYDLLVQRVYDFLEAMSRLLVNNEDILRDLFRAGTELAESVNAALKESKGDLQRTIKNAADSAEEAKELLAKVNRSVGNGDKLTTTVDDVAATAAVLRKDLPEAMSKLREALDAVNKLGNALSGVDRARVDAIVAKATTAMDHADKVLADANAITQKIRSGSGSLGLLVQDDEIYDDLKDLLRDIKQHPWKLVWKQ
jgi:phospholipid/cholesterol/gamma-HCH transport system substrate-binding protein